MIWRGCAVRVRQSGSALDSSADEVTVAIVHVGHVDAYLAQCSSELGSCEAFFRMSEEGASEPAVLGDVVVLEEELSTGSQ